jgi:hypothetical protein
VATKNIITQSDLDQFTGTERWHRHWLGRVTFTDGAKYLADNAGAYWLLDEIVLEQSNRRVKGEEFQVWKLTREVAEPSTKADGSLNLKPGAVLTCDDGNDTVVFTKRIEFTDFPLAEIKLYFADNVVLLPSEY